MAPKNAFVTVGDNLSADTSMCVHVFPIVGVDVVVMTTHGEITKMLDLFHHIWKTNKPYLKAAHDKLYKQIHSVDVKKRIQQAEKGKKDEWNTFCTDCFEVTLMRCAMFQKPIPAIPASMMENINLEKLECNLKMKETDVTKAYTLDEAKKICDQYMKK